MAAKYFCATGNRETLFHLPLSQEAYEEFMILQDICNSAAQITQEGNQDRWTYWGLENFTVKRAYRAMSEILDAPIQLSWLWDSCCQQKHKFFFWLTG